MKTKTNAKNQIPTEEEFARASKVMKERYRGMDDVRRKVLDRLCTTTSLHDLYIFVEVEKKFRAVVFLKTKADVTCCEKDGTAKTITDCILEELNREGRGTREDISLQMEFDSDDKYNGNYFLRLR